jgi:hypothetical protein
LGACGVKAMKLMLCAIVAGTSGCASILSGTSESIVVDTNPAGADCTLKRHGETLGQVTPTPNSKVIDKTKYNLEIVCSKPGYQEATYIDRSGIATATFGNILLGGLVGWAIDSSDGADNHYESPINLTLIPNVPLAAATPVSEVPTVPLARAGTPTQVR